MIETTQIYRATILEESIPHAYSEDLIKQGHRALSVESLNSVLS